MTNLSEEILLAFRDELLKTAGYNQLVSKVAPRLRNIGSGAGMGTMVGMVGGAGLGGLKAYHDAGEQGLTGDARTMATIGGVAKGTALGGAAGTVAGGVAGAATSKNLSEMYGSGRGLLHTGSRFGQRQVHSVTGMLTPQQYAAVKGQVVPQAVAQGMDLSSIPGYAKAVMKHGPIKPLMANAKGLIAGTGTMGALGAASMGIDPAVQTAKALHGPEYNEQGQGRFERIGQSTGNLTGLVAGSAIPLTGSLVAGSALGSAGRRMGKAVDSLRHRGSPQKAPLEQAEAQHMPTERVMSPAAAGQHPDIGGAA